MTYAVLPAATALAVAFGLTLFGSTTHAAPPAPHKAELKEQRGEIRERIDTLRRDMAKTEQSRADAAEQLRETEKAISDANRGLRKLNTEQARLTSQIRDLETQTRRLDEQIRLQQEHLGRLLYRHYTERGHFETDALNLLLSGTDPNQSAMDYQFLKSLSQAKADLIDDLRKKTETKQRLTETIRDKGAELQEIENEQRTARTRLFDQQKQRKVLLAETAARIKAQRREIGALQRDERRLTALITKLAKASKRKPASPAAKANRQQNAPVAKNERVPEATASSGKFAALRGKLALPVRGAIVNRFGQRRPEGATTWKGLFIRASEGTEVRAVASGEVVFADWLRGFGNLMVIDHDGDYLSVYGNNQSLLKEVGQTVSTGEPVATVGSTGGNPESGLYFELRYQGQAFDPIRWVRLR